MKAGFKLQKMPEIDSTRLLREMQLEAAVRMLRHSGRKVDSAAVKAMILYYETEAGQMQAVGETGESRRLARRAAALKGVLAHGPDPARMVAETELPESYRGKILLMVLNGGGFEGMVCLRSGDDWHREILRNTQREMEDLGFRHIQVHPLGGACAGFEADGSITLWGTSDEYGCCDKEEAARMIARAYPGKPLRIED
jgi:hypothetical protein